MKDNQISKETYIVWIDLMIGLTNDQKKQLYRMDRNKLEFKYKLTLLEKIDEMIG